MQSDYSLLSTSSLHLFYKQNKSSKVFSFEYKIGGKDEESTKIGEYIYSLHLLEGLEDKVMYVHIHLHSTLLN